MNAAIARRGVESREDLGPRPYLNPVTRLQGECAFRRRRTFGNRPPLVLHFAVRMHTEAPREAVVKRDQHAIAHAQRDDPAQGSQRQDAHDMAQGPVAADHIEDVLIGIPPRARPGGTQHFGYLATIADLAIMAGVLHRGALQCSQIELRRSAGRRSVARERRLTGPRADRLEPRLLPVEQTAGLAIAMC